MRAVEAADARHVAAARAASLPVVALALVLLLAGSAAWCAPPTPEAAAAARQLDAVREEIRVIASELGALQGERDAAAEALREGDRAVSAAAKALRDTEQALAAQQQLLDGLEEQRAQLAAGLTEQRAALAALLRSAHALGRHQRLKLLLAQDRLEAAVRALSYHRYFQRERVERIERVLGELEELAALGERIRIERAALDASHAAQQQAVAALEGERNTRAALLAQLHARHADRAARLRELGRDEQALVALLARLRDVFADIPRQLEGAQPLAERKGALPRPLPGAVRAAFGGTLPDGRRSNGLLIAAEAGAEVRAVAHGRIAFADWLRGYGLIAIVDHGDGFMSLYAQNDALLAEAGAWVQPGDVLATVGSSGGQERPALYFELRRNGKPVDPTAWLAPR